MERANTSKDISSVQEPLLKSRIHADAERFAGLENFEGHTFYLCLESSKENYNKASLAKRIDLFKGVILRSS